MRVNKYCKRFLKCKRPKTEMMYAFQLLYDLPCVFECTQNIAKPNLILGNAVSVIYL